MSIRIREGRNHENEVDGANLYDSSTGEAFGRSFRDYEEAEAFLGWATYAKGIEDLRKLDRFDFGELFAEWRGREAAALPRGEAA